MTENRYQWIGIAIVFIVFSIAVAYRLGYINIFYSGLPESIGIAQFRQTCYSTCFAKIFGYTIDMKVNDLYVKDGTPLWGCWEKITMIYPNGTPVVKDLSGLYVYEYTSSSMARTFDGLENGSITCKDGCFVVNFNGNRKYSNFDCHWIKNYYFIYIPDDAIKIDINMPSKAIVNETTVAYITFTNTFNKTIHLDANISLCAKTIFGEYCETQLTEKGINLSYGESKTINYTIPTSEIAKLKVKVDAILYAFMDEWGITITNWETYDLPHKTYVSGVSRFYLKQVSSSKDIEITYRTKKCIEGDVITKVCKDGTVVHPYICINETWVPTGEECPEEKAIGKEYIILILALVSLSVICDIAYLLYKRKMRK